VLLLGRFLCPVPDRPNPTTTESCDFQLPTRQNNVTEGGDQRYARGLHEIFNKYTNSPRACPRRTHDPSTWWVHVVGDHAVSHILATVRVRTRKIVVVVVSGLVSQEVAPPPITSHALGPSQGIISYTCRREKQLPTLAKRTQLPPRSGQGTASI
jgi:hypothetical protein